MLPHEGALWILRIGLIAALIVHVASAGGAVAPGQPGAAPWKYAAVKKNQKSLALLAHHALGRAHAAGLHRLAPAELHDRQGQPEQWRHRGQENSLRRLMVDSLDLW